MNLIWKTSWFSMGRDSPGLSSSEDQTNRYRGKRLEKQKMPDYCQNSDKNVEKTACAGTPHKNTEYRNHKPCSN